MTNTTALAKLIGAQSLVSPDTLPLKAKLLVRHLVKMVGYTEKKLEERAAKRLPVVLFLNDIDGYKLALRVILHADARTIVETEAVR